MWGGASVPRLLDDSFNDVTRDVVDGVGEADAPSDRIRGAPKDRYT